MLACPFACAHKGLKALRNSRRQNALFVGVATIRQVLEVFLL
jgi:hypothetical protein